MPRIGPGDVIDDRYELETLIGEGGFGVVYRARQRSTQQAVALKFLVKDRLRSHRQEEVEHARFQREMQLIARLKHPNIVRLIDSGTYENKHPYMVLEFVEGRQLSEVVQAEGALERAEAAHLMFQVLDAVNYAHEHGVVHRDLKPQNILLTEGGFRRNAVVLDFGVAGIQKHARDQHYVSLTAKDEVRGTPAFMAPEQLMQRPLTPQTDIYAWGLVFIECLTGEPAVEGESPFDIALRQADEHPIPVPISIDDAQLRSILRRAIAKPLDARYASASEALADLQMWLANTMSSPEHPPVSRTAPAATEPVETPTVDLRPASASRAPTDTPPPPTSTASATRWVVAAIVLAVIATIALLVLRG